MPNIAILGSGMGGFGAAYRFHAEGITPVMYDKNAYHGGHTASFKDGGFIFDQGPHISFTKDRRIQDSVCRQRRPDVRDDAGQPEQLLAWLLAAASGAVAHAWVAGRRDCEGHHRLCGRAPGS